MKCKVFKVHLRKDLLRVKGLSGERVRKYGDEVLHILSSIGKLDDCSVK